MNRLCAGVVLAGLGGLVGAGVLMGLGDDGRKKSDSSPGALTTETPNNGGKEKSMTCDLTVDSGALELLKRDVGVWDCEVTFWFNPDAPPVKTSCTMTSKMALDGMYREDRLEGGTFGPAMGNKAWSSLSYTGYNSTTKQIEAVRMASTNSTMIVVRGGTNAQGNLELTGEYMLMGAKATNRDVTHVIGPGHQRIETYMSFGGSPEFKGAEIEMKLRK